MNATKATKLILEGNILEFQRHVTSLTYDAMCDFLCDILDLPQLDQQYAGTEQYRIVREAMSPFNDILRSISKGNNTEKAEIETYNRLQAEPYIEELSLGDKGFTVFHTHTSGFSAIRLQSYNGGKRPQALLHVNYLKKYEAMLMFNNDKTRKATTPAEALVLLDKF